MLHQEYTAAPAPSTKPLLAAVTRTIESILNESDLKVNFLDAYNSVNKTKMTYTVDLPESKSGSALLLLNASISDNSFSSTLSKILGIPITTKGSYKRYTTIVWMNTATSTSASPRK